MVDDGDRSCGHTDIPSIDDIGVSLLGVVSDDTFEHISNGLQKQRDPDLFQVKS